MSINSVQNIIGKIKENVGQGVKREGSCNDCEPSNKHMRFPVFFVIFNNFSLTLGGFIGNFPETMLCTVDRPPCDQLSL